MGLSDVPHEPRKREVLKRHQDCDLEFIEKDAQKKLQKQYDRCESIEYVVQRREIGLQPTDQNQSANSVYHTLNRNNNLRVLHASWHQQNPNVFNPLYAGSQCVAMSLAGIIKAHLIPPSRWTSNTYDQVLSEGDVLYEKIRVLSKHDNKIISPEGYLLVSSFNVIRSNLIMYNRSFTINYDRDPAIFGTLNDRRQCAVSVGSTLIQGLRQLFEMHRCGILIASRKSFAVMHFDNKFYFADSHSCNDCGKPKEDGRACIIECGTLFELNRICRQSIEVSGQFTLDFIDVKENNDSASENQATNRLVGNEETIN